MKIKSFIKITALAICCSFIFNGIAFAKTLSTSAATAKISEDVAAKLVNLADKEKIPVYVYMLDDSDEVMAKMSSEFPELHTTYTSAKESVTANFTNATETVAPQRTDTSNESVELQRAIATKRQLYSAHYSEKNTAVLKKYCSSENFLYVSSFSPMAIVSMTANELKEMTRDPSVKKITLFDNKEFSVSSTYNCNVNSRAKYVKDTYGNDGYGVKIGQIELATPNLSDIYLASASVVTNTSFGGNFADKYVLHATQVAKMMVGIVGMAPAATLYSASADDLLEFYQAVDWLVLQGVNVINASTSIPTWYGYTELSAYVDHLAVQHDVHFVTAAGNKDADSPTYYIESPGTAFNAITVGAYNDNGTVTEDNSLIYAKQKDDYLENYSKYLEGSPTGDVIEGPPKPNLVAQGNDIWSSPGTSYAAPQVTAVIAQLCGYDPALKVKQSSMGAILMASCGRKLAAEVVPGSEIVSSGSFKGGTFVDSASCEYNNQISQTQGAGKLDAYWARTIVASDTYWSVTMDEYDLTYEKTVYITKGSETLTRVAIFWLKRNTVDDSYNITEMDIPNWDLEVFAPDGTCVGYSMINYSNFEIVQFVPPVSGNYKIVISRFPSSSGRSNVGIAVW